MSFKLVAVLVLAGEVDVLVAVPELVDAALVTFLQDEVAFEGTVALFDNVKSAHYKRTISISRSFNALTLW